MHPAYSVILFTTASGAGYGLLAWLCVSALLGLVPAERGLGLAGFGLALALITAGLLSSTAHLGRPGRAWRAFSQWRTSWLSREGVMAVATYVPALVTAFGWVVLESIDEVFEVTAALTVVCALGTLYTTGMIYASLRTIRQWHQPLTAPLYIALGLASGAVLLNLLLRLLELGDMWVDWLAGAVLLVAHSGSAISARFGRWSRRTRSPTS
jgi:sulfite dehydrogenase (quinone) subunit SoeC